MTVTYQKKAFTLNGGANGLITLTNTTDLVVGAIAFLSSDTVAPTAVVIDTIVSATEVYTKQLNVGDYNYFGASALLVLDNASLSQLATTSVLPSQVVVPHELVTLHGASSSWLTLNGQVLRLTLVAASGATPGIVTPAAQSFDGAKTFTSAATMAGIEMTSGALNMWGTDSSGTPGAATIDKPSGKSAIALGAASVVITNNLVTAASRIIITPQTRDATCKELIAVPGAGSFTVSGSAAATANLVFSWEVSNIL